MSVDVSALVTENIDIWSSTIKAKNSQGRGSSKKTELYGIKKLRELILELAVRGLLVPQDPNDHSVAEILSSSLIRSRDVMKLGKGAQTDLGKKITEHETPFYLPDSWSWVRLGKILELTGGSQPPKSTFRSEPQKGYTRLIQIRDFKNDNFLTYVPDEYANRPFVESDIMIGRYGPPVFQILRGKRGTYNVALMKAEPVADAMTNDYLFYMLNEPRIQNLIISESERTAGQSGVRKELVYQFVVGLPPIREQYRIVTKVNELMTLCDQLEQQQESSISAHQTLVETLLGTLVNAAGAQSLTATDGGNTENTRLQNAGDRAASGTSSPGAIFGANTAWQHIAENFDLLFTTEHSINQLKQTILQLAVMGKLVPQDPNDEPASALLKKIAEEKARLVKEKKIKKQKPLPPISEEEKPFELPEGWEWCRFQELIYDLKYGTSKRSDYEINGSPILRIPNVVKGYIDSGDLKRTVLNQSELKDLSLKEDDIVIIRSNGSSNIVGSAALVDKQHEGYAYAGYLVRARINTNLFSAKFVQKVLQSKFVRLQIEGPLRTTSGVKNINSTEISMLKMPCLSLTEQARIVTKVNELMTLCDTILECIKAAQTTQLNLTDAIAEQAIV